MERTPAWGEDRDRLVEKIRELTDQIAALLPEEEVPQELAVEWLETIRKMEQLLRQVY